MKAFESIGLVNHCLSGDIDSMKAMSSLVKTHAFEFEEVERDIVGTDRKEESGEALLDRRATVSFQ